MSRNAGNGEFGNFDKSLGNKASDEATLVVEK